VEPLSWTDDMMLRAERPETPMRIQMLLNYDQTTAPAGKVTTCYGSTSLRSARTGVGRRLDESRLTVRQALHRVDGQLVPRFGRVDAGMSSTAAAVTSAATP
jgi:hypothetical protein